MRPSGAYGKRWAESGGATLAGHLMISTISNCEVLMKDAIKLILEIIKIGRSAYKAIKKERRENEREKIRKALADNDRSALRNIIIRKMREAGDSN